MNFLRSIFTLLASLLLFDSLHSQKYGDTLFVAPKDGLLLLELPEKGNAIVDTLNFNDRVIFRGNKSNDTIGMRMANWVEVETFDQRSGYLFIGYLNKRKLPENHFSSLRSYEHELIALYPVKYQSEYVNKGSSDMDIRSTLIQGSDDHLS